MTYEVMISTARDVNTPDEWLFDAAEKIQPAENELIVAVAENPNASEKTIIELWLSVAIMNGENNIKMLTAEAIGAISNRVASEMLLDEIVEILKNNDCYWEIAEWERLRSILINGKNANYLREKFPEIIEMKYPGTCTYLSEAERRVQSRWYTLDEYFENLRASMTPEEWEAYEERMLDDSDYYDDDDFDDDDPTLE